MLVKTKALKHFTRVKINVYNVNDLVMAAARKTHNTQKDLTRNNKNNGKQNHMFVD